MSTQISLFLKNPSFTLQKQEFPASYTVQFKQNNQFVSVEVVEVQLSPADFEALLNQGRALIPSQQITLTSPQENATWREAAWPLFRLDDKGLQCLMREVSSDKLIYTLWFLKNLEFARKVIANMSARAGACLTEDLVQRFSGKNPDVASAEDTQNAHACLREVLDVVLRLQAEGQIQQWS
ncbi:MAG: hypothetical protein IPH35_18635 [Rhodoferax sp.]|nr:hypothetical protein [Rhodoferax sp.]